MTPPATHLGITRLPPGSVRSQHAVLQFGECDRSDGDVVGLRDPGDERPVTVELDQGVCVEDQAGQGQPVVKGPDVLVASG